MGLNMGLGLSEADIILKIPCVIFTLITPHLNQLIWAAGPFSIVLEVTICMSL
jgi:hypothetical protein